MTNQTVREIREINHIRGEVKVKHRILRPQAEGMAPNTAHTSKSNSEGKR